jgi:hypothetical protein
MTDLPARRPARKPAPHMAREDGHQHDLVLRELARLTWIVEEMRETVTGWRTTAAEMSQGGSTAQGEVRWLEIAAGQATDILNAAGEAEYRTHPARMLVLHTKAAKKLADQIAAKAEAQEMASDG